MIRVREATAAESLVWAAARPDRVRQWFGRFDAPESWVDAQVTSLADPAASTTYTLVTDDGVAGCVALELAPYGPMTVAVLTDIWVEPARRRTGIGTAAREWAQDWAAGHRTPLFVTLDPDDVALAALFAGYPVRSQTMMKRVRPPVPPTDAEVAPMTEQEFAGWLAEGVRRYARDTTDSGSMPAADALRRAQASFAAYLPDGLHTPDNTFLAVRSGDQPVATIWLRHHRWPGVSFVLSVDVEPAWRSKGYGRAAMTAGERATLAAGDTHLALNVFGHNTSAINLYSRMDFSILDQTRSTAF